jgi:hypothetical protein
MLKILKRAIDLELQTLGVCTGMFLLQNSFTKPVLYAFDLKKKKFGTRVSTVNI